jgi:hypothetical protein
MKLLFSSANAACQEKLSTVCPEDPNTPFSLCILSSAPAIPPSRRAAGGAAPGRLVPAPVDEPPLTLRAALEAITRPALKREPQRPHDIPSRVSRPKYGLAREAVLAEHEPRGADLALAHVPSRLRPGEGSSGPSAPACEARCSVHRLLSTTPRLVPPDCARPVSAGSCPAWRWLWWRCIRRRAGRPRSVRECGA